MNMSGVPYMPQSVVFKTPREEYLNGALDAAA
jgi:hypothetical protein